MTTEEEARNMAFSLVFSEMRKHIGMRSTDFPIASARVAEGSDGSRFQNEYIPTLSRLIGAEDRSPD